MIKVVYYGNLARMTGTGMEMLDGDTVGAVLREIKKKHGTQACKTARMSHILVNSENAGMYGGYAMKLKDGDVLTFFPVCGGG